MGVVANPFVLILTGFILAYLVELGPDEELLIFNDLVVKEKNPRTIILILKFL